MSHAIYQIDPAHSSAQFTVRHLMISNVRGEFTKLSGRIDYDPADPAASSSRPPSTPPRSTRASRSATRI